MNSKEMTLKRLEHQGKINAEEMKKNGRVSLISKLETEYLKEVLRDLEILEILKPYFQITNDGVRIDNFFCIITDEEKCNKIKEWLDNEH